MAIDTPTNETAAEPAVAAATAADTTSTAAHAKPGAFKVSLEHFATRLSASDKRVALIHGWVHSEKRAKKFRDLPANYQARFAAFASKPITQ